MRNFFKKISTLFVSLFLLMGIGLVSKTQVTKAALTYSGNYEKVTNVSALATGDKVVIGDLDGDFGMGSGWDGTKDAKVSTTESDWIQYEVTVSGSTFTLKDPVANNYIASPGSSNQFKYGSAGSCSVDENGVLKCNNRFLCKNGTFYRMYGSISSSYQPFYVYKVGASDVLMESIIIKDKETNEPIDSLHLVVEDIHGILVEYTPDNVTDSTIIWTTSNSSIAEFDKDAEGGYIFAYAVGEAVITATAKDKGGVSTSIHVYVEEENAPHLTGVTVSGTPKTPQFAGSEFDYTGLTFTPLYDKANPTPDEITGADITWPTLEAGMTSIVGSYHGFDVVVNGVTVKDDTLASLTVSGDMTKKVYHLEETWDPSGLVVTGTYESGKTATIEAGISWTYSDEIANYEIGENKSVDVVVHLDTLASASYTISGITINEAPAVGSAMFDFENTSNTHLSASALVSTPATVEGVSISVNKNTATSNPTTNLPIRLYSGFKFSIATDDTISGITSLEIVANSAAYATVLTNSTWTPSATVTASGSNVHVEFSSETKTVELILSAQSRLNSLTVNYNKVKANPDAKVESITLAPDAMTLDVGATGKFNATVLPGNAYDTSVTWDSSNKDVATVDGNGNVSAVSAGITTITATANDGSGVVGSASVTVNAAPIINFEATEKIDGDVFVADGVNFAITKEGTGTYTGYAARGAQFGSGTNNITANFETKESKFDPAGLKVVVDASHSGSGTSTLKVFIGNTQLGETVTLGTSEKEYTFLPSEALTSAGKLRIELHNDSGAVYLKTIRVYGTMSTFTEEDKLNELITLIESLDTCNDYARAPELREMYNALSEESKATFDATTFDDKGGSVTLGDKLAYMEYLNSLPAAEANAQNHSLKNLTQSENLMFVVLIGALGLGTLVGYYFVNKKRSYR